MIVGAGVGGRGTVRLRGAVVEGSVSVQIASLIGMIVGGRRQFGGGGGVDREGIQAAVQTQSSGLASRLASRLDKLGEGREKTAEGERARLLGGGRRFGGVIRVDRRQVHGSCSPVIRYFPL